MHDKPIIIFAEHHDDPITGEILAKLAPELKQNNYLSFYDEIPTHLTEHFLEFIENEEKKYFNLTQEFTRLQLDIHDARDIYQYSIYLKEKQPDYAKWRQEVNEIETNIERHDARVSFIKFMNIMDQQQVNYRGIDSDLVYVNMTYDEIIALTKIRDTHMAQFYLEASTPVFGRIGLKHAEGIQCEIAKQIPLAEAQDSFLFFYIYSREVTSLEEVEYIEDIKEKKINLPLNIVIIDATGLSTNELMPLIKKEIEKKELALQKYVPVKSPEGDFTKSSKPEIDINNQPQIETDSQVSSHATLFNKKPVTEKKENLAIRFSKIKPFT